VWLVLTAAACKVSPHGEWDIQVCADGQDNDGDGKIDCDDPDCWAFACVGHPSPSPGGNPSTPPPDAAVPKPDAGEMVSDPLGPPALDDGGPEPSDDAGSAPSCTDGWTCKPGEACVDGECQPIDISGVYQMDVISARVPSRTKGGVCFDFELPGCDPDVYIVVTRNGVTTVHTTSVRTNTTTPTWSDESFSITLKTGDHVDFAAWEADTVSRTRIFYCSPDLLQLASGTLSCSPAASMVIEPEDGMRYEIVTKVRMVR
jgi:hypothetical protein